MYALREIAISRFSLVSFECITNLFGDFILCPSILNTGRGQDDNILVAVPERIRQASASYLQPLVQRRG